MMLCQKYLMLVLVLLISCNAFAAVEPSITPPEEGSSKIAVGQTDPRLAQKVTYNTKRRAVSSILADLSKSTEVTLKAGINGQDWQVRDRKMNIFVKDVPLASLMNSIARVMKFKWRMSEKDGVITYRLYMDRKTLLDAENRRQLEVNELDSKLAAGRKALLGGFSKLDSLSAQDMEKMKSDDPLLYALTTTGAAPALGRFFDEFPAALDALANGDELAFSGADLSPAAQTAFMQGAEGLRKLMVIVAGSRGLVPNEIDADISKWQIRLNSVLELVRSSNHAASQIYLGDIEIDMQSGHRIEFPLLNPSSDTGKLFGQMIIKNIEQNQPPNANEFSKELKRCAVDEGKKNDFGDPPVQHSDDPSLQKKVKLPDSMERELNGKLEALSKASKMNVISDSFGRNFGKGSLPSTEVELKGLLDSMATSYDYNWDKQGSIIEFRDRYWFKKRADEIPDAWIEKWRSNVKKNGMPSLDDLADTATLSEAQYEANVLTDDVLGGNGLVVHNDRDVLRLYAALDNTQRVALFSKIGLDLRSVSEDQWPLVKSLINRKNGALLQNTDKPLRLVGFKTEYTVDEGNSQRCRTIDYSFKVFTDADEPVLRWSFGTHAFSPKEDQKPSGSDVTDKNGVDAAGQSSTVK